VWYKFFKWACFWIIFYELQNECFMQKKIFNDIYKQKIIFLEHAIIWLVAMMHQKKYAQLFNVFICIYLVHWFIINPYKFMIMFIIIALELAGNKFMNRSQIITFQSFYNDVWIKFLNVIMICYIRLIIFIMLIDELSRIHIWCIKSFLHD
jgi:hypothetical protein